MFKEVIFYNQYHNGDVHFTRSFVRDLMAKIPAEQYSFAHFHSPKLLSDIPGLLHMPLYILSLQMPEINNKVQHFVKDNVLYINTWVAQADGIYMKDDGISLVANYKIFNDILDQIFADKYLDPDKEKYLPWIDAKYFDVKRIREFANYSKNYKKVFISNGPVLSGQSTNFDFDPIISAVARKYPGVLFCPTNDTKIDLENVIPTKQIIQLDHPELGDLNENSVLSTYCDLIIGRGSGPFSFAMVKENINKRMVSITNDLGSAFWHYCPENMFWIDKFGASYLMNEISEQVERVVYG